MGHAVYGMPEGICIMKKPNPWDRIAPADCVNPATWEEIAISRDGMQPPTCNITKSNQTTVTRHYQVCRVTNTRLRLVRISPHFIKPQRSWATLIQHTPSYLNTLGSILMCSSHLHLGLSTVSFHQVFQPQFPMHGCSPPHVPSYPPWYLFVLGVTAPQWPRASSFTRFLDHTQRRTTVGRTPLDEWSARPRDLYLTHNTHNRQTSRPQVGFEHTISAGERPQTYALDRAATGSGNVWWIHYLNSTG